MAALYVITFAKIDTRTKYKNGNILQATET